MTGSDTFNVYCDESCHLENDGQTAMVLGAVWCPTSKAHDISVRIREIRDSGSRRRSYVMPKTVVLVYSGGLDTSVCIPMMREDYGFERVVTVTVDVGLPPEELKQAEEKAKLLGTEHYTVDAKDEFVAGYVFPAIKANGDYQGYPISTSIAR